MKNKGDAKLRARLSRKELQSLCKKYGLPANRSSSEMAKSLASFFEKNTNSILSGKRLGEVRAVSVPACCKAALLPGASANPLEYPREDRHELHSCLREGGNRRKISQSFRSNEFDHCSGDKTYDGESHGCSMLCFQATSNCHFVSQWGRNDFDSQVSPTTNWCQDSSGIARDNWVEDIYPIQQINVTDVNSDSCPTKDIFPSTSTFKAASSSSFEFYVRNEEGINLCVDLSSSPSDWIQKLKSEVNIYENMCQNKSSSFPQELGHFRESNIQLKNSFLQNIDGQQVKDGNVPSGSSPSEFMKENKDSMLNEPDGGDGSLTSIAIKPSSIAVVVSEHLQEDKGLVSSEPNSDVPDGTRSCTDENGCSTIVDSDVNTPGKKLSRNFFVSILDCPKSLATLEHQNSRPSSEFWEYSTVENSCSLANSQVVTAGCPTGGSKEVSLLGAEIQQKDASSIPCKNGEFVMDNTETEQSTLANSSEPDIGIGRTHLPTSVEEWKPHLATFCVN
ncbi:uncharacterized protein LOC123221585 isoform X2 [Mangifera indica]|uniref:uncharacterized protein LOC123221585 isoform X2 n=1 Tax=Mangifera indica TaxID=29780 RepID=UPI001CFA1B72|nr:uncharacterized protein LOC123221585 isoform X2 [Mangifera indica]